MSDVKRMSAREKDALLYLAVADDAIGKATGELKGRMKMIRFGSRDLAMIRKRIAWIHEAVMNTMPTEQHQGYLRTLHDTEYMIGSRGPVRRNKAKINQEWGMWVSYHCMNVIMSGCRDKCLTCALDTEGQRRCPLRKAFDELFNDAPDKAGGECPYQEALVFGEMEEIDP